VFVHSRLVENPPIWILEDGSLISEVVLSQEANENIPNIHSSPPPIETASDIVGPITRSRAKQLEKEMNSQVNANLVLNNQIISDEPMLLSTCFNILRNDGVHERAWDDDGFYTPDIRTKELGRA
jgi:hypothetical protein